MEKIILFTDGGSRGNPGPAGIGMVVKNEEGHTIERLWKFLGVATNNQAEYRAILEGLKHVLAVYEPQEVSCYLDSELVVKQLNGEYKVKNKELIPLYEEIRSLVMFRGVHFHHVPRERNQEADACANTAMDDESDGHTVTT